jgi:uncharacterized protein (DUF885 family)
MFLTRRVLMGSAAATAALAAAGCNNNRAAGSAELNAIFDRLVTEQLRESPETCTGLAISEEQAGGRYIDRLADVDRAALGRYRTIIQTGLTDLRALNRAALSDSDRVSLDVVATQLENNIADVAFEPSARYPYVITQLTGAYVGTPDFLASQHPITNADQTEAYMARLQKFAANLDVETQLLAEDAARGLIPPDFALDRAVGQQQSFSSGAPAQNILVTSLASRLAEVAEIPEADRTRYVSQAEGIVRDAIFPAYQRQIEAIRRVRAQATHDAGIWHVPRGDEMYATALRAQTTTEMTADEIHQMGLDVIAQHRGEMEAILRAEGLTRGSVAERIREIGRRPDQTYPNTDAGREQCLRDLNDIVVATKARMPEYFGLQARADLEIRRIPPYNEAGAAGGYYQQPALDGSRPGAYYINLRDMRELTKFGLETLTYHEGLPGHHWQLAIQQEAHGIPFIRTAMGFFGAFIEGWALYSEQLMDEAGVYAQNPINRLGYLQSATFRASRLVVDTGMHSNRWTREQAIESMAEATGDTMGPIISEIERYSVWPGQACCYMVGKQAILRSRETARATMGDRFDLKGFHDTVIGNGSTPLSVTDQLVQAWAQA